MNTPQEIKEYVFSSEQIESFSALGSVLKRIRRRLITEGYTIESDRIYRKSDIINSNEETHE